jgi:dipeptidase E
MQSTAANHKSSGGRLNTKNRKIFAIGGGGLYNFQFLHELIRFSGKEQPNFLFVPTAAYDSPTEPSYYGSELEKRGCKHDTLFLLNRDYVPEEELREKILSFADVIYVPGGNTLKMVKRWREVGVDRILEEAMEQGKVLSGSSAGMLCWFESGHSDSMSYYYTNETNRHGRLGTDWFYVNVQCLNFIKGLTGCPHYHGEDRVEWFHKMVKEDYSINVGIGVDDGVAFQVEGDGYRIFKSSNEDDSGAWRVYRRTNREGKAVVEEEAIEVKDDFAPLADLLVRP